MLDKTKFYINGQWVAPIDGADFPVVNPATEEAYAIISLGGKEDAEAAIAAAKAAFPTWSITTVETRIQYLEKLLAVYEDRMQDMAHTISSEMGAPIDMSLSDQAQSGRGHLKAFIRALGSIEFQRPLRPGVEGQDIAFEAAGVAALITPWNWPMNQVVLKVGAALAAGCTMVLKPSEIAPMSSMLFAECVDAADFPAGVFNMLNGDGAGVGSLLSAHPNIDVVSFTGSTRAGVLISKAAALLISTPARVEPVNDTTSILGWADNKLPTPAPSPFNILKTPAGKSAASTHSANSMLDIGAISDGFSTIVHPAANAAPTFSTT